MENNGRLISYILLIKKEVIIKVIIGLLICVSYVIQAVSMAAAVTHVFEGASAAQITFPAAIALGSVFLRGILYWWHEWYGKAAGAIAKEKIRFALLRKVMDMGPGYLNGKRSGRVQSLLMDGVESLEPFLVQYVPQMLTVSLAGLFLGIYVICLDRVTGVVIVAAMILCVVVPYLTIPFVKRGYVDYWKDYAVLNAQYIDAIQGMPTLMAFNSSKDKGRELAADAHGFYITQIHNTAFSLLDSGIMLILTSIVSTISVIIAAMRADSGMIGINTVGIILFLAAECARPMIDLNNAWHSSFLGLSVAGEMFELLDEELMISETEEPVSDGLEDAPPSVELESLTFRYPGSVNDALKDVTMDVDGGRTIAVVGRSGSGKSTLVNLLFRFYDPSDGSISINGNDIKTYDFAYLRKNTAAVFQDTYLFNDSVMENLRIADPDADDPEIIEAAKAAQAHDFINKLPDGYDTVIGERGVKLSGGEKQRISIARAILKNAPFLILDEATSSVDAKSEALIQNMIDELSKGRTTIIIAHRLSTIRHADCIYVLDEGRLAECGTHVELISRNGVYASLIRAQREGVRLA